MTTGDNKPGSMVTGSTVPEVHWDESKAHTSHPEACSVNFTREDVCFLFGSFGSTDGRRTETSVRLHDRIMVSPFVAKRLAGLLRNLLAQYESAYGPSQPESDGRKEERLLPLPGARNVLPQAAPIPSGDFLFQLINDQGLRYGYERSFKLYRQTLLGNRYLLTLEKNSLQQLPPEKIFALCERINMPGRLLTDFKENLPHAQCVHFGFEENKEICIYKAYLEFPSGLNRSVGGPNGAASFLLYLGFKWDAADPAKQALSSYRRYPAITIQEMLERVATIYGGARCPSGVVKGITDIASARADHQNIFYLEVTEDDSPRKSFDINVYNADILVGEVYPLLAEIGQYYSISFKEFHTLYDGVKERTLGHISGGIDRQGRDFLTVYHGMQAVRKQEMHAGVQPRMGAEPAGSCPSANAAHSDKAESRDASARGLFEAVKGLNIPIGLERSFKVQEKRVLGDRFLVGFPRGSLQQESILDVCRKTEMPEKFVRSFQENLAEATLVLFGFEGQNNAALYKAYLEFGGPFKAMKDTSRKPKPFLSHLGFKWDVSDPSLGGATKYTCFPMLTEKEMLERLSLKEFFKGVRKGSFETLERILRLATCRAHPYDFLYLEAEEDGNPRASFDINMYRANLTMKEIYPFLLEIGRIFSVPEEEYHNRYEAAKNLLFGHIQAGIDRKGRDFFSVYYGDKEVLGSGRT